MVNITVPLLLSLSTELERFPFRRHLFRADIFSLFPSSASASLLLAVYLFLQKQFLSVVMVRVLFINAFLAIKYL